MSENVPDSLTALLAGGVLNVAKGLFQIALLSYLIYQFFCAIRGTRAVPVLSGAILVAAFYQICGWLELTALHWLMSVAAPYAGVALIVVFQREIRRALSQMALQFVPKSHNGARQTLCCEDVVFAVNQLSQNSVGALIVIERETGLRTFVQSGVALDSRLTSDLLVSIFQRSSPLHDGGVIVQGGRIAAASCFLPLTTNVSLKNTLGSRHRAALGVTEESDALAVAVSETDGRISLAVDGEIETDISLDQLRLRLIAHLGPVVAPPEERPLPVTEVSAESAAATEEPSLAAREMKR